MRLDSIHLKNFRCFEDFVINLDPQCTVLVGDNGSGKTALLDALAVAIGSWLLGFNDAIPRPIYPDDIRRTRFEQGGQVFLEPSYPVEVTATGTIEPFKMQWTRSLKSQRGKTTLTIPSANDFNPSIKFIAEQKQTEVSKGKHVDLPLIAYYGTGRLWVQKRDNQRKESAIGSRIQGYVDCLDPASNHKLFTAWMRKQEEDNLQSYIRFNQKTSDRSVDPGPAFKEWHATTNFHLNEVSESCAKMIDDAKRIFYSLREQALTVEMQDGRLLPFNLLSDGYRNLIAMVADIVWRAAMLNPKHTRDPLEIEGVVLIDEIDLHLHPKWQRTVLPKLTKMFPYIQWVVTTHSPQVLASAKREWVRLLGVDEQGKPQAYQVGPTEGRDSNAILEDVMGVSERPEGMQERLTMLFRHIDDQNTKAARDEIEALAKILGEDDTALVRARWMIEMDSEGVEQGNH